MNFNLDQVLNKIPYPISKDDLVQKAGQIGLPDQFKGLLDKLPNQTFNSPDDLKKAVGGMGGIASKIGGFFK
jgi:hypothetical protein